MDKNALKTIISIAALALAVGCGKTARTGQAADAERIAETKLSKSEAKAGIHFSDPGFASWLEKSSAIKLEFGEV